MQQYFQNREVKKTSDVKKTGKHENIILANERVDSSWKSEHYIINNSTFAKMGFSGSSFKNDDLRFNTFIDCYFRRATFEVVNFTGCKFINCNFDDVNILNCTFDYCTFESCFISYDLLKGSISTKPNIRWGLCKNLSLESLALGYEDEFRKYYFAEKEASEEYYWKKFWHKGSETYYNKYNEIDRLSGLINFILSKVNKCLWGYGERLSRLVGNIVMVIIGFTVGYYLLVKEVSAGVEMTWVRACYISLCNFFTVTCDYTPDGMLYKLLSVSEGGIGIILMGFSVAALFRYINRRS